MNAKIALSAADLVGMIDHSILKPFGQPKDIEKQCAQARSCGFDTVAIHPAELENCVRLLVGSRVRAGAASGFPSTRMPPTVKLSKRAMQAGEKGVVRTEITDMATACRGDQ